MSERETDRSMDGWDDVIKKTVDERKKWVSQGKYEWKDEWMNEPPHLPISCEFPHSFTPALVGLSIAYSLDIASSVYLMLMEFAHTENFMTSVERVITYTNLEPEAGYQARAPVPGGWPRTGSVSFENVCFYYFPRGHQILKGERMKGRKEERQEHKRGGKGREGGRTHGSINGKAQERIEWVSVWERWWMRKCVSGLMIKWTMNERTNEGMKIWTDARKSVVSRSSHLWTGFES